MQQNILKCEDVSLNYHTNKNELQALKNITFAVKNSEFVSIVGPSGSGKTTILSLIAGLIKPSSGTITFLTKSQNPVGYMFQRDLLFDWRTIQENLLLGLPPYGARVGRVDSPPSAARPCKKITEECRIFTLFLNLSAK